MILKLRLGRYGALRNAQVAEEATEPVAVEVEEELHGKSDSKHEVRGLLSTHAMRQREMREEGVGMRAGRQAMIGSGENERYIDGGWGTGRERRGRGGTVGGRD